MSLCIQGSAGFRALPASAQHRGRAKPASLLLELKSSGSISIRSRLAETEAKHTNKANHLGQQASRFPPAHFRYEFHHLDLVSQVYWEGKPL